MGKNRKRNKKNKKNNEQTFDAEVKISTTVNFNSTVKYPKVVDAQNQLTSLTITESSLQNTNSSKNIEEMLTESKKETIAQNSAEIKMAKINPNSAGNSQSPFAVNYKMEKKPFIGNNANEMQQKPKSNDEKIVQPWSENYFKAKVPMKTTSSRGISSHEVPAALKALEIYPEGKGYPESSKTTGTKPKATPQIRNSMVTHSLKKNQDEKHSQMFNQTIRQRVNTFENNWKKFAMLYTTWKSKRQNTIAKLQQLVRKVHEEQRGFNQTNVFFKDLNVISREIKDSNSSPILSYLTSFAACATDAFSGVTSVVQAASADIHMTEFKKIMEDDTEITKPLHAVRSQCLEEYRNVEEVVRQCHFKTFGDTLGGISSVLKVEDLISDIKSAKGEDSVGQIIDDVALFFKRNANLEVMGEVYNSFNDYLESNPAALEACKSAGKAMYGLYDTWGRNHNQGRLSIEGNMSIISNKMMLMEQRKELSKLRSIASDDDEDQAKLESEIHGAISSLQRELREISDVFEKNQAYNKVPWYF